MSYTEIELESFRGLLARRLGLHFGEEKRAYLQSALMHGMLAGAHSSVAGYLFSLETSNRPWDHLVEDLTVGETYFFRQWEHFQVLAELVIPARIKAGAQARSLRVLSAGCASGEEAFSLAMLIAQRFPSLADWKVVIIGVDINAASLAKAGRGCYSAWALRDTPSEMKSVFFRPLGQEMELDPALRATVMFHRLNLSEANEELWRSGRFDFIFCRNMLMYFTPSAAEALVERMAQALVPGGHLFVGPAESLRGVSKRFKVCNTHHTAYYQLLPDPRGPAPPAEPGAEPLLLAKGADGRGWVEAIQTASDNISRLTAQAATAVARVEPPPSPHPPVVPPALDSFAQAVEWTRQERYAEALQALRAGSSGGIEAQLLDAALLVNLGRNGEAESVCAQLLSLDAGVADAHYILALCREQAGELGAAADEDRLAISLDPTFGMPWLHLGLLARRQGEPIDGVARFGEAMARLPGEDAKRILYFSGGFGREGLLQMCHNSLRSMGQQP